MTTHPAVCVRHQCGTCGRYVPGDTIRHAYPAPTAGRCPQHGQVTVHCGRRPSRSQT